MAIVIADNNGPNEADERRKNNTQAREAELWMTNLKESEIDRSHKS